MLMLEDRLNPVHWMSGFRLYLPHYFGQKATFQVTSVEAPDDAGSARHGLRVVRERVRASVSVVRPFHIPTIKPSVELCVVTSDSSFPPMYPPSGSSRP
jgi:hypothetical protein